MLESSATLSADELAPETVETCSGKNGVSLCFDTFRANSAKLLEVDGISLVNNRTGRTGSAGNPLGVG